jgi:acetolactate synthase-1/2/3 large subunit
VPIAAEAAIDALLREGITHVFSGPGAAVPPLLGVLGERPLVRGVSARHEHVAAFMADGFARASGELAACAATRGPAAASLTRALHAAYAESVPVLAIVGEVDDPLAPRDDVDPVALFAPVTKWAFEIRAAEQLPGLVQRAAQVAVTGRPRPVMVSVPLAVQQRALAEPDFRLPFSVTAGVPAAGEIARAAEMLAWSTRPAIVVGGGAERQAARTTVAALADALGAPVACAWQRKSAFPNDHPAFVGMLGPGGHGVAEHAVSDADVVLTLGCQLARRGWIPVSADAALLQVDIDPEELGRAVAPAVALCGDAEATARELLEALGDPLEHSEARWQRRLGLRSSYEEQTRLPDDAGLGTELVRALAHAQQAVDPIFVVESSALGALLQRHLPVTRAASYYGGGGAPGWGFGAALGAQLARPVERVLCVSGADGFWMVAQDLETAVRERIGVVTVAVGDEGVPDLAALARLAGAHGERVERPDGLAPAIDRALAADGPAVVHVAHDVEQP